MSEKPMTARIDRCPLCDSRDREVKKDVWRPGGGKWIGFIKCYHSWHNEASASDSLEQPSALPIPLPSAADMLQNLLAVIHRDGGQYVAEHGLEKASKDAERIVANFNSTLPSPGATNDYVPNSGNIASVSDRVDLRKNSSLASPGAQPPSMTKHEFETLWSVCSHLETMILGSVDVPQNFRDNLHEGFRVLRFRNDNLKAERTSAVAPQREGTEMKTGFLSFLVAANVFFVILNYPTQRLSAAFCGAVAVFIFVMTLFDAIHELKEPK